MRLRRRLLRALRAWPCVLALGACGSGSAPAPAPTPAASATSQLATAPAPLPAQHPAAPPAVAFVAPQPWRSTREGAAPVDPPPLPTWRALVTQNQPLQTKTPRWQSLPPRESAELAMPPQSAFRCVVTPLQVAAEANDFGTKLKAWVMVRNMLCSADDFRTWIEHVHGVRLAPEGTREEPPESGLLLRERDAAGGVRHSYVLLRSDEESRAATTGPPRVLPGVQVDED